MKLLPYLPSWAGVKKVPTYLPIHLSIHPSISHLRRIWTVRIYEFFIFSFFGYFMVPATRIVLKIYLPAWWRQVTIVILMSPVAAELLFLGFYFSFLANGRPRFTWPFYIILLEVSPYTKHCLNFSFVFSAPLPASRNLSTGPSPTLNCLEVPLVVLKISTPLLWLQLPSLGSCLFWE